MYYSKLLNQVCEGVLVHPVTRETYGGTDFCDLGKLAELQAVPLTESDGVIPDNPVLSGALITVADDGLTATRTKTWRSKTQNELDVEYAAALAAAGARVNAVRDTLLESLTVTLDGNPFDADNDGRENLNGVLTAISLGIPVGDLVLWRDSTNVNRSLTHVELVTLGGMMLQAVQQVYGRSWQIKDELLPGYTTAQLQALDESALAALFQDSSSSE